MIYFIFDKLISIELTRIRLENEYAHNVNLKYINLTYPS